MMEQFLNRLAGQVAVVTGAGCIAENIGIGRAIALTLAKHGATVIALDRSADAASVTANMILKAGGKALAIEADARDLPQVKAAMEKCHQQLGKIDILANCVGGGKIGGAIETTQSSWQEALDLNLTSAFICSNAVLPMMVQQKRGAIVHIGSLHGTRYPGTDMLGYCVAKAGLMQLSRCIALEFATQGIRSNTVLAGAVDTPEIRRRFSQTYGAENVDAVMAIRDRNIPQGKCATVWDVANAALFLVSEDAKHITGTELAVDGGASAVTVPSYVNEARMKFGR